MPYSIKEIYFTLQGEGFHAGRPAVFCRFAGCNLWTGREADRKDAVCQFCDTQFVGTDGPGGGRFESAEAIAAAIAEKWPGGIVATRGAKGTAVRPLVVCTGGEPLLQLDAVAVDAMQRVGFEVAVETNGTQAAPENLDWITVSPKAGAPLKLTRGSELKLVYPQTMAMPENFAGLAFEHFYLQPMDGPDAAKNTKLALQYCLSHPQWRLSLQTHKMLGIP